MKPLPKADRRKGHGSIMKRGHLRESDAERELDFDSLTTPSFMDELADAAFYGGDQLGQMTERLESAGYPDHQIWDFLKAGREIDSQRVKKKAAAAAWAGYPTSPEMRVAIHNARDTQRSGKPRGTLTLLEWETICGCWGHRCAYCSDQPGCLTIEHVKPICDGGRTRLGNIVPSCTLCNRSKGTRDVVGWLGDEYPEFKRRFDAANEATATMLAAAAAQGAA